MSENRIQARGKTVRRRVKALDWFTRDYRPLGYALQRSGSGHLKVIDPDGAYAGTLASTPSDVRGMRNAQAHLRRWESARRDRVEVMA